eukprot:5027141-Pleurochrysis_carterae.AAC.1
MPSRALRLSPLPPLRRLPPRRRAPASPAATPTPALSTLLAGGSLVGHRRPHTPAPPPPPAEVDRTATASP